MYITSLLLFLLLIYTIYYKITAGTLTLLSFGMWCRLWWLYMYIPRQRDISPLLDPNPLRLVNKFNNYIAFYFDLIQS